MRSWSRSHCSRSFNLRSCSITLCTRLRCISISSAPRPNMRSCSDNRGCTYLPGFLSVRPVRPETRATSTSSIASKPSALHLRSPPPGVPTSRTAGMGLEGFEGLSCFEGLRRCLLNFFSSFEVHPINFFLSLGLCCCFGVGKNRRGSACGTAFALARAALGTSFTEARAAAPGLAVGAGGARPAIEWPAPSESADSSKKQSIPQRTQLLHRPSKSSHERHGAFM